MTARLSHLGEQNRHNSCIRENLYFCSLGMWLVLGRSVSVFDIQAELHCTLPIVGRHVGRHICKFWHCNG